jgi:cation diffusion facilitator family transporter
MSIKAQLLMKTNDILYRQKADKEKRLVALSSVLAAVFLTSIKIIVGLLTGSLGILSEAAHSGLDLVAAAVTFFAIRMSGRPPDTVHTYGHGKVENISALFETLLLFVTCVWIIYEAIQRLFFKTVEVEPSIWAFAIMAISIGIDFTRSRALGRVAKKYGSQALEADALHFSTDIWSSTVVIAGLGLVVLSQRLNIPWLAKADAIAAIGVAGIVIYVSVQLGSKTISDLLDAIPPGVREMVVNAVRRIPDVVDVERVRVRRSGPDFFADVTLTVDNETALEHAHEVATQVENGILQVLAGADVVVKVVPQPTNHESMLSEIRLVASRFNLRVHGIRIYDVLGSHTLEMHVEVNDNLNLVEAHNQVNEFEEALRKILPGISQVTSHIEPIGDSTVTYQAIDEDEEIIQQVLKELSSETGIPCSAHNIIVHRVEGQLSVSFHCNLNPSMAITDAHILTERIEQVLRSNVPNLGRVVIHVEPDVAVEE